MYVTSQADVTLFGGAAGSGKSEIGVIDFLQYVGYQNFIGVITRRTTVQLKGAGGILTKCMRTFKKCFRYGEDFVWKEKDNKFVFYKQVIRSDGKKIKEPVSEIYLKHFEHERNSEDDWQGVEANLYLADEGTQFTIGMLNYIMSRMRNPACPEVEPKLKITCNPDADHAIREWVEPYLNEDGTPDRSKDGMLRYFTAFEGEFCWGDTKQEVIDKTGADEKDVLSFTFISANVYDNKVVQEVNPKYVAWLKGLTGVKKHRLLYGNWRIRESDSTVWEREWIIEEDEAPPFTAFTKICRAWDFADKLPSSKLASPDYTASVKMGITKNGDMYILSVTRHRLRTGDWLAHVIEIAEADGRHVDIIIPQDPGVQAKLGAQQLLLKPLNHAGFTATFKQTNQKKLERFRPFASASQNGFIHVVKNCGDDYWNKTFSTNDFWYKELETFTGDRKRGEGGHDDVVDCCSDSYGYLSQSKSLPAGFLTGLKGFDTSNKSPLLNIN